MNRLRCLKNLFPRNEPFAMSEEMKLFSKELTQTDIKKRFAIPTKILDLLPDFKGRHAVHVLKNGYKKPVFSYSWRNFVICHDFHVGDKLTMYKVQDEAGSFHYRVVVERLARPSVALSAGAPPLNHEADETTGTSCTKISNFEPEQRLPKDDAPVKQEGAIMELADSAADVPVPFIDHVIAKPPGRIFGTTGVSFEATSKAHFKLEHETEMKLGIGITMGETPLHACYMTKEEKDIKEPFDLNGDGSMGAYETSQAAGEAYYKITGRLSLDLVLGQPSPYDGAVNLDLSLTQPIADTR